MTNIASTIVLAVAFLGGCAGVTNSTTPSSAPDSAVTERAQGAEARAPRIVQGDLDITNQTSLDAFEDLEVVTGTLTIMGNTRLPSLDGLERLRAVRELVISENLALENVEGLAGLRHVRLVTINGNPRLESLRGLESLRRVDRLVVSKNGIYCTTGLAGLTDAGDVVISSNPRLISLRGLSHLVEADNVTVVNNPRLSAQPGLLDDLRRVSGKLTIDDNAGLHEREVEAVRDRFASSVALASR